MKGTYTLQHLALHKMQSAEINVSRKRLLKQARAGQPSIGHQVLAKAAQVLIAAGESLKVLVGQEAALNA